ncbi:MAG: hypothetical protein GKR87_00790 [Kiritimatiellae bacterium]|nr:hypothetical protein [Kiritimatiellia bacterium]
MRYTGYTAMGDRGEKVYQTVLTFRVEMAPPTRTQLREAKRLLIRRSKARSSKLLPLPIRRLETILNYMPIDGEQDTHVLPGGHFESSTAGDKPDAGYWTERNYTLRLRKRTDQLFWTALQEGQLVISLSYAFLAHGIHSQNPFDSLSGDSELIEKLTRSMEETGTHDRTREASKEMLNVIHVGTTTITVDAKKWPELFREIDINERIPPGYAVLDVYCYDFNNRIRTNLYEKQLEIQAEGAGGRYVKLFAMFQAREADIYAYTLRSSRAIRLDRPYRYRVTEIDLEGRPSVTPWETRNSWADILDVTKYRHLPESTRNDLLPGSVS